jgi:hypothetical protein
VKRLGTIPEKPARRRRAKRMPLRRSVAFFCYGLCASSTRVTLSRCLIQMFHIWLPSCGRYAASFASFAGSHDFVATVPQARFARQWLVFWSPANAGSHQTFC